MSGPRYEEMSDEEAYANAYLHFLTDLETLSENAERQCEIMGNFNVSWEIRDHIDSGGRAVLKLSEGRNLSETQRRGIKELLNDVSAIPDAVFHVSNVRKEHLKAMRNPCWAPIRSQAKKLIALLEPETKRVKAILGMQL